jgi:hypothetical protein
MRLRQLSMRSIGNFGSIEFAAERGDQSLRKNCGRALVGELGS